MSTADAIVYDLKTGYPHMGVIQRGVLANITTKLFEVDAALQYAGTENGATQAREQVAYMLSGHTAQTVTADDIHMSSGAIHGLDVVSRYITEPGDIVLVENPTFYYVVNKLKLNHVQVMGVPMQHDGVDLDALEQVCQQHGERISMFYVIPSYHNPTGYTYSAEKRQALIALAQKYDFTVVEDTIYQLVYFDQPPPPMIREFDTESGHVISLGSFSKLVMPSIRTGWVWATPQQVQDLRAYYSSASSTFMAHLAGEMIANGDMEAQLDHARAFYGAKHDIMVDALRAHAPDWLDWVKPDGGYFIWCTLPGGIQAADVFEAASQRGVSFMPGRLAYVGDDAPDRTMRLCFAMQEDNVLTKGIEVLCAVLKELPVRA